MEWVAKKREAIDDLIDAHVWMARKSARSPKPGPHMPLHDCAHTFMDLATTVLPGYMASMREAMRIPTPMANFCLPGVGVRTLLKEQKLDEDFSGCYTLVQGDQPIYVGISRTVIARLRQHVNGKTHFDASLAYKIAASRHQDQTVAQMARFEAMQDLLFGNAFLEARNYLRSLSVAYVKIPNPLELYVFEPYCAIELDTHQWNSFETH